MILPLYTARAYENKMAVKQSKDVDLKGQEDTISRGSIEVCRLMHPDDANIAGNVHGGTTLKLIEEAGVIIATRHCNKNGRKDSEPVLAALARVERTDFLQPMYIGEVAQVHVELSYASKHSLEVKAFVWVENLITGSRRLTNRASLWYVPVTGSEEMKVITEVPAMEYSSKEEEDRGRERYERQKRARLDKEEHLKETSLSIGTVSPVMPQSHQAGEVSRYSVYNSQSSLIHSVQPSDCSSTGYVLGGVTMKMMDEVGGIVAFRHCKTNVVTASIDAIDFHAPVKLGYIIHLTGRATFTSSRSMEIEVVVDGKDYVTDKSVRTCSAFFTYVSLDDKRRPQAIPPLELHTDEEQKRFEAGKKRYLRRKERRTSQN